MCVCVCVFVTNIISCHKHKSHCSSKHNFFCYNPEAEKKKKKAVKGYQTSRRYNVVGKKGILQMCAFPLTSEQLIHLIIQSMFGFATHVIIYFSSGNVSHFPRSSDMAEVDKGDTTDVSEGGQKVD